VDIWAKNISEARKIQKILRSKVIIKPLSFEPEYICGVDASFSEKYIFACASLFKFPELIHIEDSFVKMKLEFPYIPNFLSFREGKAIMEAIKNLKIKPQIILFDGQGIAHPLSFGIASHIGVLLDIPSIGCAKSRLVGEYEEPKKERGSFSYLYYRGKIVGAVLRTKTGVKPIFVSPGHLIDIESSIEVVLKATNQYRIPEPLRKAHQRVSYNLKNLFLK